jgi:hypothetical protein
MVIFNVNQNEMESIYCVYTSEYWNDKEIKKTPESVEYVWRQTHDLICTASLEICENGGSYSDWLLS